MSALILEKKGTTRSSGVVKFSIIHQEIRRVNLRFCPWHSSNGWTFTTASSPQIGGRTFLLRGINSAMDGTVLMVSEEDWNSLLIAVEEFNKDHGEKPGPSVEEEFFSRRYAPQKRLS